MQRHLNRSQSGGYKTQRITTQVRCLLKFDTTASPVSIE